MFTVYLASPYSYKSKFKLITQSARIGHFMTNHDSGFDSWKDIDLNFIDKSDEVWVCMMSGWKESIGVQTEIKYELQTNKGVRYINEKGNFVSTDNKHLDNYSRDAFKIRSSFIKYETTNKSSV